MKLNKKNKGKVHPSPSPSPSPSATKHESQSLNLLPAAILTIISILSLGDREVLAYMITRSIKAAANPAVLLEENRRRRSKNPTNLSHKSPCFHCGCFDCYTSYWFRWDSSPNRELIHQAIEAFEEHVSGADASSDNCARGKKREKSGCESEMLSNLSILESLLLVKSPIPESVEDPIPLMPEETRKVDDDDDGDDEVESFPPPEEEAVARTVVGGRNHKGLARKVLPDVIGLFHSRLWSLWSPNV